MLSLAMFKQAKQMYLDASYGGAARMPNLPGPTEADVLASDLRLRRRLASQKGSGSTMMTGGLGSSPARITLPSLVGV